MTPLKGGPLGPSSASSPSPSGLVNRCTGLGESATKALDDLALDVADHHFRPW